MNSSKIKASCAAVAGTVIGSALAYYLYRKLTNHDLPEDSDEGIGDVDSIVSEAEVLVQSERLQSTSEVSSDAPKESTPEFVDTKSSDHEYKDAASHLSLAADSSLEAIAEPSSSELPPLEIINKSAKPVKVLILGLQGCGKTSLLNILAKRSEPSEYTPTQGFNAIQIEKDGTALSIMEVGGNSATKKYWKNFTNDTSLLVYIVDGSDSATFDEAKMELKQLLAAKSITDLPCLLIANKQDLQDAQKASTIFTKKDIRDIGKTGNCNITLLDISCAANSGRQSTLADTVLTVVVSLLEGQ